VKFFKRKIKEKIVLYFGIGSVNLC